MGAGIGCLYSAAFPEQVERLVLLEGVGPLARNPHDVAKHVRSHVQRRLLANADPRDPRVYPSLEKAVQTRCFTAKNFPGSQWLSTEAATEMVLRGSTPVGDQGELKFRHDPRLQWPSLQYFTPDQTESLYDDIQCPTALLLAQDGWPFDEHRFKDTIEKLQPSVYRRLPGSHHFHADPDSAERAAEEVITFLSM
jgi:pimeloyl-ACP methyl ester carboxylesterase